MTLDSQPGEGMASLERGGGGRGVGEITKPFCVILHAPLSLLTWYSAMLWVWPVSGSEGVCGAGGCGPPEHVVAPHWSSGHKQKAAVQPGGCGHVPPGGCGHDQSGGCGRVEH